MLVTQCYIALAGPNVQGKKLPAMKTFIDNYRVVPSHTVDWLPVPEEFVGGMNAVNIMKKSKLVNSSFQLKKLLTFQK